MSAAPCITAGPAGQVAQHTRHHIAHSPACLPWTKPAPCCAVLSRWRGAPLSLAHRCAEGSGPGREQGSSQQGAGSCHRTNGCRGHATGHPTPPCQWRLGREVQPAPSSSHMLVLHVWGCSAATALRSCTLVLQHAAKGASGLPRHRAEMPQYSASTRLSTCTSVLHSMVHHGVVQAPVLV